ncbi:MAG: hypothetical protein BWK78_05495 [Thiotrichaceae bacterium IS1]|nr:MAG: hypothetical protein BWK78_05495 [Thiotrichaceae bacterium IS1]
MTNEKNLLSGDFAILLKEAITKSGLPLKEIEKKLQNATKNPKACIDYTTLSKLTTGEKTTLKQTHDRRETLLLLIKVLPFETLEKCNQFLRAAKHEGLTEEERKKYCPLLKSGALSPVPLEDCQEITVVAQEQQSVSTPTMGRSTELPKWFFTKSTKMFIEELFAHFKCSYPAPILLLTQIDRAPMIDAVFSCATTHYPANLCCHLTLPCAMENYFSQLAQRCGFSETVSNSSEFEMLLSKKLSATIHPYFLLVSRFEYAPKEQGQELAGIFRSLNEQYANHLHLILCGGQKLEELKYLTGEHSLLNSATVCYWPELNREEVFAIRDECCQGLSLSEEVADQLLTHSGGHPTLLKMGLQWYQQSPLSETLMNYPQRLSETPEVCGWFTPYLCRPQEARKIVEWLAARKIAPAKEFLLDQLLRELYWKNLIVKGDGNWIYWRCEAIRLAGTAVLVRQFEQGDLN